MNKKLIITGLVFFAIAVVARLLPHLPNFVPVAALALFAGVYLPKKWSLIVPLIAMFVSDLIVGFYEPSVMVAVYASFALTVTIGWAIRKYGKESGNANPAMLFAGSIANSTIFFLITNAAVWAFTQMYAKSFAGLMLSYEMALPFFKWTLVGDLAWVVAFFGAYALVVRFWPEARLTNYSNEKVLAVSAK